jgi:rRNA maturation protein Nop10
MKNKCPVCGRKSIFTDLCESCWNVEIRIENYLKSDEGKRRLRNYLKGISTIPKYWNEEKCPDCGNGCLTCKDYLKWKKEHIREI